MGQSFLFKHEPLLFNYIRYNRKNKIGGNKGEIAMSKTSAKSLPATRDNTYMGAKIANQINTNQQSNMCLTAYSAVTQSSSTVNISLA